MVGGRGGPVHHPWERSDLSLVVLILNISVIVGSVNFVLVIYFVHVTVRKSIFDIAAYISSDHHSVSYKDGNFSII